MHRARLFSIAGLALLALAFAACGGRAAAPQGGAAQSAPGAGGATPRSAAAAPRQAAQPPRLALRRVAGTYSEPVYVAQPPGDSTRLFIVEKTGRIRIVKNGTPVTTPFLDIHTQVSTGGEQGLLSVAFDPHYARNRFFYIDYTDRNGDTRVVRYAASASNPDRAAASTRRVLLAIHQPFSNHNGGLLQFGPDGRLYVGLGDGGSEGDPLQTAQNDSSPLGKILRVTLGTSPVRVVNYTKGMRNPWRFSFDRSTGALWIGDVGQDRWEEIDRLRPGRPAGANLGWSGYEGDHVYNAARAARLNKSTLVFPVAEHSHAVGQAIVGGYVYRGSAIPALRGYYLFADEVDSRVFMMDGPKGARIAAPGLDGHVTNPSSFGQDNAGELYIVSLDGSVYKIVPG